MKLLQPISIAGMAIKNRMVMAPMTTNYGNEDQTPSDRLIAFLLERARGGVGLITVEVCTVDVRQKYQPQSLTLGDDSVIAAHRRLTDALHAYDVKVQPQLTHPGPESMSAIYFGEQPVAPTACNGACTGLPARELAIDELDAIVEAYAQGARRAREAGYDGIELHAAHCYMLLGTFLSPLKNKRQDDYGADTAENRTRLLVRVLKRIKAVAGQDFPVTLRISGFERIPGGRDASDTARIAPALVAAGVDAFHVSGGVSDPMVSQMICGSSFPDGYNLPEAEALKRVVDVPVMVVGRFLDPEFAEQALRDGRADMIVMGRPLLADPELPNKVKAGRVADIRRCISCQNCIDSMFLWPMDARMNCAVNAATGRELTHRYEPVKQAKHIVIVGGGPAGMETARICAERGHRVTLLERNRQLGGALRLASTVHSDNERFLSYLLHEMRRLPISVRSGCEATMPLILSLQPDELVIATGAALQMPEIRIDDDSALVYGDQLRALFEGRSIRGAGLPFWLRAGAALLRGRFISPSLVRRLSQYYLPLGKHVAILGGDLAAIELAEFVAKSGRRVNLLYSGEQLAPEIGPKRRLEHELRLETFGVSINCGVTVQCIEAKRITYAVNGGGQSLACAELRVDSIVLPGEPVASTDLHASALTAGLSSHAIGDCTGLGLIVKATSEAAELAHSF